MSRIETKEGIQAFYADSRRTWRTWLQQNGASRHSVWLIIYKKDSGIETVTYPEAVEEALCFGWIDSKPNKRDENSFYQFFAKRKPGSNWSKINKDRVEKLIQEGKMTGAGLAIIEQAKTNGAWSALDGVEGLTLPPDLQELLLKNKKAAHYFDAFPKSVRKGILEWILNARTPSTRARRIEETVRLAGENIRANQYKPKLP